MVALTLEGFELLCKLTVDLTAMRQKECKHLCIENFGPELLEKLIIAVEKAEEQVSWDKQDKLLAESGANPT